MDRKLQIRVSRNGPTKDSQEEKDCAAWLIKNGSAKGSFVPDNTRPGGHVSSVMWRGLTPAGEKKLARFNLLARFLSSQMLINIIVGIVVAVAAFFILRPFQNTIQPPIKSHTQPPQATKHNP